jgi:transposase
MEAYSEDLRRKVVEALERGLNKSEAARLFGMSLSSVKRFARMAREGWPLKPGKARGKRPKINENGRRLQEAFAKMKALLRRAGARTHETLVEAMGRALEAVTVLDARGFFEHCGYRLTGSAVLGQPLWTFSGRPTTGRT